MKRQAKKVAVGIAGGAVALAGMAMLVLPGPGIVVLLLGIAILATEFEWARRLKERVKDKYHDWKDRREEKKAEESRSCGRG